MRMKCEYCGDSWNSPEGLRFKFPHCWLERQALFRKFLQDKGIVLDDKMMIIEKVYLQDTWDPNNPNNSIKEIHYTDENGNKVKRSYFYG